MTRNQIEYLALKETRRANAAREAETHRSNVASEGLTFKRDMEVVRSNLAKEGINRDTLRETERANLARELETNRANVAKENETNRSNLAKELEANRSNVARETETARHNTITEAVDAMKAGASTVSGWAKPLGAMAGLGIVKGLDGLYYYSNNPDQLRNQPAFNKYLPIDKQVDKRSPIQKQMAAIRRLQTIGNQDRSKLDPHNIIPKGGN